MAFKPHSASPDKLWKMKTFLMAFETIGSSIWLNSKKGFQYMGHHMYFTKPEVTLLTKRLDVFLPILALVQRTEN